MLVGVWAHARRQIAAVGGLEIVLTTKYTKDTKKNLLVFLRSSSEVMSYAGGLLHKLTVPK